MRNKHRVILGASGTGKTYYAVHEVPEPVIFFNPEGERPGVGRSFVRLDRKDDLADLTEFKRVEYVPHYSPEIAKQELNLVVDELMNHHLHWWLVVDEAQHMANPQGKAGALEKALFRGRKHGLTVWMVSQSPRRLADDAVEQAGGGWVLFKLPYSRQYLKRKLGEVADEYFDRVDNAPEYSFVEWDFRQLSPVKQL